MAFDATYAPAFEGSPVPSTGRESEKKRVLLLSEGWLENSLYSIDGKFYVLHQLTLLEVASP